MKTLIISKFIPKKIESLNKFINRRGRSGNYAYKKYRNAWFIAIGYIMRTNQEIVDDYRYVEIVRYCKRKIRDYENLCGGGKPLPDGLVKYGWLKDDSMKWAKIDYTQELIGKSGHEEGTQISIYKLDK